MSRSPSSRRQPCRIRATGRLPIEDGEFEYWPSFLQPADASRLCRTLIEKVTWHVPRVFVYGRWLDSPRQAAWYGDHGVVYRYSGTENLPLPWLDELDQLRSRLMTFCPHRFNGALLNHYRSGPIAWVGIATTRQNWALIPSLPLSAWVVSGVSCYATAGARICPYRRSCLSMVLC